MKVSKKDLIDMNACSSLLERFIKQTDNVDESVEVSSLVGGENTYGDLLWLADKGLDKDKIVKFACSAALISIELMKAYTEKYDLIVDFLSNPVGASNAVNCAAYATDATYAARSAYAAARASDASHSITATARAARAEINGSDAYNAYTSARAAAYDVACTANAAYFSYIASRAACAAAHANDDTSYAVTAVDASYVVANAAGREKINKLLIELFTE